MTKLSPNSARRSNGNPASRPTWWIPRRGVSQRTLVQAVAFRKVQALRAGDEFDPDKLMPPVHEAVADDIDAPGMDLYDDYESVPVWRRVMAVFVDTAARFAYFVRRDPDHAAAVQWVRQNRQPLLTTDER
jgi:hypothetical protein